MSWENIASQSAASASKIATQLASQALDDFLSEEEDLEKKTTDFSVSSATSASQAVTQLASQALDDFLGDKENQDKDD